MEILRISAFSDGDTGGNPAGVVIEAQLPDADEMQKIAHDVGFSETAFATPYEGGYRVRYFSPESEVPFCGHATIALGAALARNEGNGVFQLKLNEAEISVEGSSSGDLIMASLQSPPTKSEPAEPALVDEALALFDYSYDDLDMRMPPAIAQAGATHLIFTLQERHRLAAMDYDLDAGRALMKKAELVTISLIYVETNQLFHARNAFASGGVLEDPATGAAAAALAGYLRDLGWPHGGEIDIIQGEDMGVKSILKAEFSQEPGSAIKVSGFARLI